MSTLGNVLWWIFGGLVVALGYLGSGITLCATVIGIPFGIQNIKLGIYALLPFGHTTVATEASSTIWYKLLNVIWFIGFGWTICLTNLVFALLCAITVVGIPFAVQHMKLAELSLAPFGKEIRDA